MGGRERFRASSAERRDALILVAAVARNGVIGGDNRLLWRLPSDLKHFKALTMGKPLVMGRRTYQSIGRLLPGRETIVVTRDRRFSAEGGARRPQPRSRPRPRRRARRGDGGRRDCDRRRRRDLRADDRARLTPCDHRGRARARGTRALSADRPRGLAGGQARAGRPRAERRGGFRLRRVRAGDAGVRRSSDGIHHEVHQGPRRANGREFAFMVLCVLGGEKTSPQRAP